MSKESFIHELVDDIHAVEKESLLTPDSTMFLLTWVTFFLLLAILYKYAWKPILDGLDTREKYIRKSITDADKIKEEMEHLAQTQRALIQEAQAQYKTIIDQSRKAAKEVSKIIEEKARDQSQIMLENAKREIKEEKEKAQADLRTESAHIAVDLAGKLIEKNLDSTANRKFINEYIKRI